MVKGGPLERGGEKRKYYRLEMVEMCRMCFLNLPLPQHCHYTRCIYLFPSATLEIRAQIEKHHEENRPKQQRDGASEGYGNDGIILQQHTSSIVRVE